jgi:hypothetical protein
MSTAATGYEKYIPTTGLKLAVKAKDSIATATRNVTRFNVKIY